MRMNKDDMMAAEPKLPTELTLYHARDLYIIQYAYEHTHTCIHQKMLALACTNKRHLLAVEKKVPTYVP